MSTTLAQQQQPTKTFTCGLCREECQLGVHVCRGCNGDVVYGATDLELRDARQVGGVSWAVGAFVVIYVVPILLNVQFEWTLGMGWGLGFWGLLGALAAGLWGANSQEAEVRAGKSGIIRTFRR